MSLHVVVVSTAPTAALARVTVLRAAAALQDAIVHVLDVDGSWVPTGREVVHVPAELGLHTPAVHRRAAALGLTALARALEPLAVGLALEAPAVPAGDPVALMLRPGMLLLAAPTAAIDGATGSGLALAARRPRDDGRWPGRDDAARLGAYHPGLVAVRAPAPDLLAAWAAEAAAPDDAVRWWDVVAAGTAHRTLREPADLLGPWTLTPAHEVLRTGAGLTVDGRTVVALDLTRLDLERPWLLDADASGDPRGRLSDHPELAALVSDVCAEVAAQPTGTPAVDLTTTSLDVPLDTPLRALYGALDETDDAPDPFDPAGSAVLLEWLVEPAPGRPFGRYLDAARRSRPDLRSAFAHVPGRDEENFRTWARVNAAGDGLAAALVDESLRRAPAPAPRRDRLPHGVTVVGFLGGGLGIGESARLVVQALEAQDVPHATLSVDEHLVSRARAAAAAGPVAPRLFDTTVLCVNADLTSTVAASLPAAAAGSRRVGMWYWEVEDFPVTQHGGFDAVDEVWVATDFVRAAIEPHSPVPVRTVTPPLPQRGPDPTVTRADLGLPDAPVVLFSFDYLSTAERKNPLGALEAFTRAFAPGEGPVLVIKSINAELRPGDAERLRLAAAARPDVVLLEEYLDVARRDALVALCDCYLSVHRSEGLGLTMAEAMAWGKPVVATGYSGNLQFMTDENSFLVPWRPGAIPADAPPYPAGGVWAEPDLDAAAALLRTVLRDDPALGTERGARAARDIAELHSPEAAGRRLAVALEEGAARHRARTRGTALGVLKDTARRARSALR